MLNFFGPNKLVQSSSYYYRKKCFTKFEKNVVKYCKMFRAKTYVSRTYINTIRISQHHWKRILGDQDCCSFHGPKSGACWAQCSCGDLCKSHQFIYLFCFIPFNRIFVLFTIINQCKTQFDTMRAFYKTFQKSG